MSSFALSSITLRDLEYALAIAETGSFSRAAERCHVSQPALSKQIKRLETQLGVCLFERGTRPLLITHEGERLIAHVRELRETTQALMTLGEAAHRPLSGVFRLGIIASSCPYLLPHFVGSLTAAYPNLKLHIQEGLTAGLIQQLQQGNLDGVIAADTFDDTGLQRFALFFEPFLLAEPRQGSRKRLLPVMVSDIHPEALLLLEDGHCIKDQTLHLCQVDSTRASVNFRATSLETLLQMTAGGLGVSVIPELAAQNARRAQSPLSFRPFKDAAIGRHMWLFARRYYARPDNLTHLAGHIRAHLPDGVTLSS